MLRNSQAFLKLIIWEFSCSSYLQWARVLRDLLGTNLTLPCTFHLQLSTLDIESHSKSCLLDQKSINQRNIFSFISKQLFFFCFVSSSFENWCIKKLKGGDKFSRNDLEPTLIAFFGFLKIFGIDQLETETKPLVLHFLLWSELGLEIGLARGWPLKA